MSMCPMFFNHHLFFFTKLFYLTNGLTNIVEILLGALRTMMQRVTVFPLDKKFYPKVVFKSDAHELNFEDVLENLSK